MDKKKKSPTSGEVRLMKKGELLVNSAKRVAEASDPVNLIAEFIQCHRLAEKAYGEHLKVKG